VGNPPCIGAANPSQENNRRESVKKIDFIGAGERMVAMNATELRSLDIQ
jgi:hypothetical protein